MIVRKRPWTRNGITKTAWVVDFTDVDGRRRQKTFPLKRDADAARHRIESEIRSGRRIAASATLTVAAAADLFMAHMADRHARGVIGRMRLQTVESVVRLHVVPHLGAVTLHRLCFADAERWHRTLSEAGCGRATIQSAFVAAVMIEEFGRKRGLTAGRSMRDAYREFGRRTRKPIRTPTIEQCQAILAAADLRPRHGSQRAAELLTCAVHLAAHCGLRFGEIMGLSVEDVDFAVNVVRVRHSLTRFDELKGPKTRAGLRDVPMSPAVVTRLRLWIGRCVPGRSGLLFRTRTGAVLSSANFHTAYWRPLLRRAGLENEADPFHFHSLRHFASSLWCEHMSLPHVAALMGHAKPDTTLRTYAHSMVAETAEHAASEGLAALLLGSSMQHGAKSEPKTLKRKSFDTPGVEVFISPKMLDHGAGVELRSQSNPLAICRRPETLVEVRDTAN